MEFVSDNVFPVKFQLRESAVPFTTEKWGYEEKQYGYKTEQLVKYQKISY